MSFSQKLLAAVLPPMPPIKSPKAQVSYPGFRTQIEPRTSALSRNDRLLATTDRLTSRTLSNTQQTVRELSKASPDLASHISFMLRTGIPEGYTVVARSMDGNIDVNGSGTAQEILRRMTFLGNADGSFNSNYALQSLSEMLALEFMLYGAGILEVALDEARVPSKFVPVSIPTTKIYDDGKSFRFVQEIGGQEISLDLPTIIYVSVDQLQTEAYPSSYLESSIQPILADIDFNNDLRRVLKRAVMPRIQAVINSDKIKKLCPPAVMNDRELFKQYKDTILGEIQAVLDNANPEDAIVTYDSVEYDYLDGNQDPSAIIERVQKVLNTKLATGAKTLPVVLGHGSNSNASSTEAMLYVKQADMLRRKLNEIYSRALTVAVRILGIDCYVEFKYDAIDLRPEAELEAFRAMEQSRILNLLSLGLLTDEEACIRLTGSLPPAGYVPKSGTMFMLTKTTSTDNPASNTSAAEQTLTPDTPKAPKSQQGA